MDSSYKKLYEIMNQCENSSNYQMLLTTQRKKIPCLFMDGVSYSEFVKIVNNAIKRIKRIENTKIIGSTIWCSVKSQTGLTNWEFHIDFNDWGHLTGVYWRNSDNYDSVIPKVFGDMVSSEIHDLLRKDSNRITCYDNLIKQYLDLRKISFGGNKEEITVFGKISKCVIEKLKWRQLKNYVQIKNNCKDFVGEHLFYVLSALLKQGFSNIKIVPAKDLTDKSDNYIYQVEMVVVNGSSYYERNEPFLSNVEIVVVYHDKKEISLSSVENNFKGMNYIKAGDRLLELGFTNIYERPIKDLKLGWLVQDGSVEQILIELEEETLLETGRPYPYDAKLIVCYHTFKT